MPLHHYIEQYFKEHPEERITGVCVKNPPIEKRPKVARIEDKQLSLKTKDIPIRIYMPNEEESQPVMIFFHGGDFVSGGLETHDVSCRMIASLSGYKVIAVGYTIPSVSTIESVLDDCYSITQFIIEQMIPQESTHQIAIGGPSIGAFIATFISYQCQSSKNHRINKQILFYPVVELTKEIKESPFQSRLLFNGKYGLDITTCHLMNESTFPFLKEKKQLTEMPETLIFTAEYDPLCDEGEWYAGQLKQAGVKVKHMRFDGNIHGFMQSFPGSPDYMRGYEITTEFLLDGSS